MFVWSNTLHYVRACQGMEVCITQRNTTLSHYYFIDHLIEHIEIQLGAGRCWSVKYIMFKITLHFDHHHTFILFTLALIIPVSVASCYFNFYLHYTLTLSSIHFYPDLYHTFIMNFDLIFILRNPLMSPQIG